MDIATLIGLILGLGVVLAAILVGSDLWIFLNLPGFLIVVGGTLAATFVKFPMKTVFSAFKTGLQAAFIGDKENPLELVELALDLSRKTRSGGMLALENVDIPNDFFQHGIQMAIDGMSPEVVRKSLTSEMNRIIRDHEEGGRIFRAIGDSAPAFGMIGTLVGLVQMLSNLSDPKAIGPAMAVAMLTTLYGALIANLIALPMADKLESRTEQERINKSLIIDSVLEIQAQTNPNVLEELLQVYLPEHQQALIHEGGAAEETA
ncbi:MAG: MotA/TolQ/ExbB proton channel family protein [Rhodospirillaceae bacterium]|nr:MotA/TolQ/ExbB proton channel family protein [Rhodospirillaceae bacterium]